jgi:pimeloyl-ACP methyl ester carboxylesterase
MRFVFVHGAFVRDGAWWWAPVAPLLPGPSVAAVLPSCGETGTAPTFHGPDLFDDADALRDLLGDGEPSVVVAHSYGAMVAAQATAGLTSVRALVALSAFPVRVGESLGELSARNTADPVPVAVSEVGAASLDMPDMTARFLHDVDDPALVRGAHERLTPQSATVFAQTVTESGWLDHPTAAIVCADDRSTPPWLQREYAARADHVVELAVSHHPMLSRPAELAATIAVVASRHPSTGV